MLNYKEGDLVEDFELESVDGSMVKLSDFKGKNIVLYFYPKDNTKGCTTEAIDFTEKIEEFQKTGCEVIGISPDSIKSHNNFISKHNLKVILLSDPDKKVLEQFGVWQLKKMYGREYFGVVRSTFVISKEQKVLKTWEKVRVKGHVDEVLEFIKSL